MDFGHLFRGVVDGLGLPGLVGPDLGPDIVGGLPELDGGLGIPFQGDWGFRRDVGFYPFAGQGPGIGTVQPEVTEGGVGQGEDQNQGDKTVHSADRQAAAVLSGDIFPQTPANLNRRPGSPDGEERDQR